MQPVVHGCRVIRTAEPSENSRAWEPFNAVHINWPAGHRIEWRRVGRGLEGQAGSAQQLITFDWTETAYLMFLMSFG